MRSVRSTAFRRNYGWKTQPVAVRADFALRVESPHFPAKVGITNLNVNGYKMDWSSGSSKNRLNYGQPPLKTFSSRSRGSPFYPPTHSEITKETPKKSRVFRSGSWESGTRLPFRLPKNGDFEAQIVLGNAYTSRQAGATTERLARARPSANRSP